MEFRPISKDDAIKIAEWRNHPDVVPVLRTWKQTNPDNQATWLNKISNDSTVVYWSIYNESKLVGYCGLDKLDSISRRAEISLLIDPSQQNRGYGSNAVKTLLDIAFNYLGLMSVYGEVYHSHDAIKFWKKAGFKEVGVLPMAKYYNGSFYESSIIVMTKDMYAELN